MSIQRAHDRFFRRTFGDPEIAADFLQNYLPAEILKQVDLSTLTLTQTTLVDDELAEDQTDLLYTLQTVHTQSVWVHILFEHKSYPDKWVLLQVLRYMLKLWQQEVDEGAGTLRPILPIVIYHGEVVWPYPVDFQSLIDPTNGFEPFTPAFSVWMKDFSASSKESIVGQLKLRAILLALRRILDRNLKLELPALATTIIELRAIDPDLILIHTILYYFTEATEKVTVQELKEALESNDTDGNEFMSTIASTLREEGRQQGYTEAAREIINNILTARFGPLPPQLSQTIGDLSNKELLSEASIQATISPSLNDFQTWLASIH